MELALLHPPKKKYSRRPKFIILEQKAFRRFGHQNRLCIRLYIYGDNTLTKTRDPCLQNWNVKQKVYLSKNAKQRN